jgi:predicted dehydrogenase
MNSQSLDGAQPVHLILAGLGKVAEVHLAAYANCAEVAVIAGVDPSAERRELLGRQYGFSTFATLEEALASVDADAACVLSPARWHEEHAVACLKAGLHVLCEKPLALTVESADRMILAAEQTGKQLGYGSSYRYLPALTTAREIIATGAIGEVLLMQEQVVGGTGIDEATALGPAHYPAGGPGGGGMGLVDHGIHLIDIFSWLIGNPIISASGRGVVSGEPLVTEYLVMQFESGATGILVYEPRTFSTALPNDGMFSGGGGWSAQGKLCPGQWSCDPGWIHVHGTQGALRIGHYANAVFLSNAEGVASIPVSGQAMPANFTAQIKAFAAAIRDGRCFDVAASVGRDALATLWNAYEK